MSQEIGFVELLCDPCLTTEEVQWELNYPLLGTMLPKSPDRDQDVVAARPERIPVREFPVPVRMN